MKKCKECEYCKYMAPTTKKEYRPYICLKGRESFGISVPEDWWRIFYTDKCVYEKRAKAAAKIVWGKSGKVVRRA